MKKIVFISIILVHTVFFGQINLNSSLTACYSLDGNANDPINSLNGTLSAVTSTVDRFNTSNSAYYFNGTNSSFIGLPNNTLIKPNAVTISAWIKPSVLINNAIVIFTKNSSSSYFTAYGLAIENTGGWKFAVYRQNGSGNNMVYSTTSVSQNVWYHVTFSIDNTSMKIYVNGTLENTTAATITSFNYDSSRGVILGGTNESNYNVAYAGFIDNVRFYNRILNASEVNSLYLTDPSCLVAPLTSFSVFPSTICAGGSVALSDLSSNNPNAWNWQVSGGSLSSLTTSNTAATFQTPGTYIVSMTSSNTVGAGNTATQSIIVLPNPTVTISSSGVVCVGQTATLMASGATTYSWSSSQTGPSLIIGPGINPSYTVVGTDVNGCKTSAQVNMTLVPLPVVNINGNTAVCPGESLTLTAGGTAQTYTWSTGATGNQLSTGPLVSTTYTVIGANANGCTNTATHNVSINALPTIFISGSGTICQGSSTSLLASGSAITFTWSNGTTGNLVTVTPLASTIYTVIGSDPNGCKNTATQLVFVNTLPAVTTNINNTSICLGDPLVLSGAGAASYSWTGGVINNVAFYPSTTNTYVVTGTGGNGCKNTASVQIIVNPLPILTHSSSALFPLCSGEPVILTAGGANIYNWSTGGATPTITVTPTTVTNYTVTGTDANGCKDVFVFTLKVNDCLGLKNIGIENDIKVYPNPTHGKFTIEISTTDIKNYEVVDLLGSLILKGKLDTSDKNIIDLNNYPDGIYFLKIKSDLELRTIKIIKE